MQNTGEGVCLHDYTIVMPTRGPGFWRSLAAQDARAAGLDPNIFLRQINQESGFNPNARSGAGAVGIAQIVPRYHPNVNPSDPYASLKYAANYMASLVHQYGGSYQKALSVYNSGQPNRYQDPNFSGGQTYTTSKVFWVGRPPPQRIPYPRRLRLCLPLEILPQLRRMLVNKGVFNC
jgi:hypothetical protein